MSEVDVMVVNFVGARHLIDRTVPKMPPGAAIASVASATGSGWLANLQALMGLISSDGFDAGKAWCEENPEVITPNTYFVSKEAINAWTAWRSFSLMSEHGVRLTAPTQVRRRPR